MKKPACVLVVILLGAALSSCATLGGLAGLVQAPRFHAADGRPAELRLSGLSGGMPLGATLRIWAEVDNPNPFGLTLSTVKGSLFLDDQEAADVNLPLGLRLEARDETVVPIDLSIQLDDLPGLARTLARAVTGSPIEYRLDGTLGVDAGDFGEPTFGPLTVLEGEVRVR